MRVLIIAPDRLQNPVGGVGVQLNEITKLLPEIDFDIIGLPGEKSENYTGVYNPLPTVEHSSLITAVGQIAYFAEAIKHQKPDIVHAYDWSSYLSGYYTAKHFGVPLVCTMQLSINLLAQAGITYGEIESYSGFWIQRCHEEVEKSTLVEADKIIQVSKAYAEQFKGVEDKTVVIHNGINLDEWKPTAEFKFPGENKLKVVYIGRFAMMKGIHNLLEAKIPQGIDLIFIGKEEGGDVNIMNRMKEKNVYHVPFLTGQDKINALCSADAVIMPSRHEPFGIVALEALASKSILLSSFVDGMSDFLTDDVAINCGQDPASIENALYRFVHMTEEEKAKRIEKGLEICKEFTWDKAAEKTLEVYKSLIK